MNALRRVATEHRTNNNALFCAVAKVTIGLVDIVACSCGATIHK